MDAKRPLKPLCDKWLKAIESGLKLKKTEFQDDADEAMDFFNGDYSFLWDSNHPRSLRQSGALDKCDTPAFVMTYNVVAELVQLFGPTMYHRNPNRQVNPRIPIELPQEVFIDPQLLTQQQQLEQMLTQNPMLAQDPMMQMQMMQMQQAMSQATMQWNMIYNQAQARYARDKTAARLMQAYLNYTPNELNLKRHARRAVDEALIKGMGFLATELYQPPESDIRIVGSFYKSTDDVVFDPDASDLEECQWIAIQCVEPVWVLEKLYGYPTGTIKGNVTSKNRQAGDPSLDDFDDKYRLRHGMSNDLLRYWKIYSKMGMGGRLKDIPDNMRDAYDQFGDYCYLAVAKNMDYPLNLHPDLPADVVPDALAWPIELWRDGDWPVTRLAFHDVPGQLYPMSHIKPALGELKFLNFAMSFVANKVRTACDDIIGVVKSAGEEIKHQLQMTSASGYKIVEIEQHFGKSVSDVVSMIQHPPFHGDIWNVIAFVAEKLDKRLGLTELAYGMSARQYRSAAEAQTKQQNFSVRPDDMANLVEEWMTEVARKEAIAAATLLDPAADVAPILGEAEAMMWQSLITSQGDAIAREFTYRIEANSARRPNKDRDVENMNMAMQALLPVFQSYSGMTGDMMPLNTLIKRWGDASDINTEGMMLNPPPMPPAMPPPGEEPPENKQETGEEQNDQEEAEQPALV